MGAGRHAKRSRSPGRADTLMGAWAPAARARGGVLVIHENRGLTDHISEVAGRFAGSGYAALALDLLSRGGRHRRVPRRRRGRPRALPPPRRRSASTPTCRRRVTEIKRRLGRRGRVAAIGFCFGGGMVWRLLASGERRLAAAAPFYGPFPEGGDLRRSRAAVLGVYAGLDDAGQRDARDRPGGARRRPATARDPHLHRGRSRLLQRHERRAVRPARRGRGLAARAGLVRPLRRPRPRPRPRLNAGISA